MLPSFQEISRGIGIDLDSYEKLLADTIGSDSSNFKYLIDKTFATKGKRIRPLLVYLSANIFGTANTHTDRAALIVEILHNATLIHDDVVDEAELRRNQPTINATQGNKVAVLTGDYLMAKAIGMAASNGEHTIIDMLMPTVCSMSEGELMQLDTDDFCTDEKRYFDIIFRKTVSLIASCMKIGAYTAGANAEQINAIGKIGEKIGYIFQIKDDMLDYSANGKTGKESGNDIKENKVTMPLICAWNNMSHREQADFLQLWNSPRTAENIEQIRKAVIAKGGLEGSLNRANEIKEEVFVLIDTLPNCDYCTYLKQITEYIIEREN
ncbi:MAG: polyprenyl synthetase family protein [Bacteroidales bacterium]|nr:polyprenyl synthetase family protein [Bacteroidales bacterium]